MMRVAIMQPYFFPYLGYWQLIEAVDHFILYDDVNFINRGWINRNQILVNGAASFINLPIKKASQNKKIIDLEVVEESNWRLKLLKTITLSYKKSPYFSEVYPIIESLILSNEGNLAKFLFHSIKTISNYLEIKTHLVLSSEIFNNQQLKGQDRILDCCRIMNATTYINLPGGRHLYDKADFNKQGIDLFFLTTQKHKYSQNSKDFIANLSILDVLMQNSKDSVKALINQYELS